jgi:hypothetical protein
MFESSDSSSAFSMYFLALCTFLRFVPALLATLRKLPAVTEPSVRAVRDFLRDPEAGGIFYLRAPTGSGKTVGFPAVVAGLGYTVYVSLPTVASVLCMNKFMQNKILHDDKYNTVGHACGGTVNYNKKHRVVYATTGHLLNLMIGVCAEKHTLPPDFVLMIDEAHETSMDNAALIRLAVYMLRRGLLNKVIIASATLGEISTPDIKTASYTCEGRSFPIHTVWANEDYSNHLDSKIVQSTIIRKIETVLPKHKGHTILVFVPGKADAAAISSVFEGRPNIEAYELHSDLTPEEMNEVLAPAKPGVTRIIVSTNIAESSLTIDNVGAVIDSGLGNEPHACGRGTKLVTDWISQSSAAQRSGRAGRLFAGTCYAMFTRMTYNSMRPNDSSELDRLMPYMLVIKLIGAGLDPKVVLGIDAARYKVIIQKLTFLKLVKVGEVTVEVTPMGCSVSRFPVSIENAVAAWYAEQECRTGNERVGVVILFLIAAIEGAMGASYYWFPKEHRHPDFRAAYFEEHFAPFGGACDLTTYMNLFGALFQHEQPDKPGTTPKSRAEFARTRSLNNKLLKRTVHLFTQLIKIVYGSKVPNLDSVWDHLLPRFGPNSLPDLAADSSFMQHVYSLFSLANADSVVKCISQRPVLFQHVDSSRYNMDMMRSHIGTPIEKSLWVAGNIMTVDTRGGKRSYASVLFPYVPPLKGPSVRVPIVIPDAAAESAECSDYDADAEIEDFEVVVVDEPEHAVTGRQTRPRDYVAGAGHGGAGACGWRNRMSRLAPTTAPVPVPARSPAELLAELMEPPMSQAVIDRLVAEAVAIDQLVAEAVAT